MLQILALIEFIKFASFSEVRISYLSGLRIVVVVGIV